MLRISGSAGSAKTVTVAAGFRSVVFCSRSVVLLTSGTATKIGSGSVSIGSITIGFVLAITMTPVRMLTIERNGIVVKITGNVSRK